MKQFGVALLVAMLFLGLMTINTFSARDIFNNPVYVPSPGEQVRRNIWNDPIPPIRPGEKTKRNMWNELVPKDSSRGECFINSMRGEGQGR